VRGQKVDHRTDIWSLGVVLYEMSSGRRPFKGLTASDVLAELLRDEPPPISKLNPNVPLKFEAVLGRMLAKERDARYQSASELLGGLRRLKLDGESRAGDPEPCRIPQSIFLALRQAN